MPECEYWVASEQIAAKRWAASTLTDANLSEEILFSYFNPETKAQVDGRFRFIEIREKPTPKLELFEDSWLGLYELGPNFIAMLASLDERHLGRMPTPADVIDGLKRVGFMPGIIS